MILLLNIYYEYYADCGRPTSPPSAHTPRQWRHRYVRRIKYPIFLKKKEIRRLLFYYYTRHWAHSFAILFFCARASQRSYRNTLRFLKNIRFSILQQPTISSLFLPSTAIPTTRIVHCSSLDVSILQYYEYTVGVTPCNHERHNCNWTCCISLSE